MAGISAGERLFNCKRLGAYNVVFFRGTDRLIAVGAEKNDSVILWIQRNDGFLFDVFLCEYFPHDALEKSGRRVNWSADDFPNRLALGYEYKIARFFNIERVGNAVKFKRLERRFH